ASVLADGTLALHSEVLGLDLHLYADLGFRFFDPISHQILRSYAEAEHDRMVAEWNRSYEQQARREAEAIAEQERNEKLQERLAKQEAEAIAEQERLAKQQAEAIAEQERNEKLQERLAKQEAEAIAEQERNKNEKLAAYLRSLGINPDEI
ncbi:MAG: hypothetical protein ACKPCM_15070, partial [Pseudanabaena sp.]